MQRRVNQKVEFLALEEKREGKNKNLVNLNSFNYFHVNRLPLLNIYKVTIP
jgi:hypothetical protein